MLGLGIIVFAYFFSTFVRVSPTIVMPVLQQTLGLTSAEVGLIGGIYFIPYGLMQVFAGALCQKFGAYKVGGVGQLLAALGILLFACADNATMLLVGRLLIGIGMGPVFITVVFCLQNLFSGSMYATMYGIAVMVSNIGAASAAAPLQFMLTAFGVKPLFLVVSVLAILLGVGMLVMGFRDHSTGSTANVLGETFGVLKRLAKDARLRCCFLGWVMQVLVFNSYQGLWSTKWLSVSFPAFALYAGLGSTASSIGVIVGCPTSEIIHRRTANHGRRLISTYVLVFVTMAFLILSKMIRSTLAFFVISIITDFLYGFAIGDNCTQMGSFIRTETDSRITATVTGVFNGIGCFACQLFEWLSGILIGFWHGPETPVPYSVVFVITEVMMVFVIVYTLRILKGKRTLEVSAA